MYNATEDEVFCLLRHGQRTERDNAMMLFQFWVLLRAVHPAFGNLLRHPAFMAGSGAGFGVVGVQFHAQHCAVALPLWRVLPCWLAVVAKGLAVGAVHFVAHAGNLVLVHGLVFRVVPAFVPVLANRSPKADALRAPLVSGDEHGGGTYSWGHYYTRWTYGETLEEAASNALEWVAERRAHERQKQRTEAVEA